MIDFKKYLDKDISKEGIEGCNKIQIEKDKDSEVLFIGKPVFVQIMSIKRADLPKMNNACFRDDGNKFYDIQLTDGTSRFVAVYIGTKPSSKQVKLSSWAGCKLLLSKRLEVWNSVLFLNESNTEFLGGKVESLVEQWEEKRMKRTKDLFA